MNTSLRLSNRKYDRYIAFLLFGIMLTIYLFTSPGFMTSIDEKETIKISIAIIKQEPIPGYKFGESRAYLDKPHLPLCYNGILCSIYTVGHSVSEIPFVVFQQTFKPIPDDLFWRGHQNTPEILFTSLFYGPIVTALSVVAFYLILRELKFKIKTSIYVSFIFGLASMMWPYSQTTFNISPMILLTLCGFLYFIKFQNENRLSLLLISSAFYAASFHIREDAILFVFLVFVYLVLQIIFKKIKLKNIFIFLGPIIASIMIFGILNFIRFNDFFETGYGKWSSLSIHDWPIEIGLSGILFSPGDGLIVYCPIVITAIITFIHFYKKNKNLTFLFLAFFGSYLIFYSTLEIWHGHLGWGPRYLLPIIPYLIIPLAETLENHREIKFKVFVWSLAIFGGIISIIKIPQTLNDIWSCGWSGLACNWNPGEYTAYISHYNPDYTSVVNMIKFSFTQKPNLFLFNFLGENLSIVIIITVISILLLLLWKITNKANLIQLTDSR